MHENRETSETSAVQPGSRSAGEGSGRTARMHVFEESHCGIVPMNHSNKGVIAGGEWGGKAVAQGERSFIWHAPDTERDCACPTGGRACGQAVSLAANHLREEPDALMSARPGLCGGHRVTGVPTAIASYAFRSYMDP